MAKHKNGQVTPEQFVRIWQSSNTRAEVVSRTGMSASGVAERACRYRRKGVPLKLFNSGRRETDYAALAKLAAELQE